MKYVWINLIFFNHINKISAISNALTLRVFNTVICRYLIQLGFIALLAIAAAAQQNIEVDSERVNSVVDVVLNERYHFQQARVDEIKIQLNFEIAIMNFARDDPEKFKRKIIQEVELVEAHQNFREKLKLWYPYLADYIIHKLDLFLKARAVDTNSINGILASQHGFTKHFRSYYQEFAKDSTNNEDIFLETKRLVKVAIRFIYYYHTVPKDIYDHLDWTQFRDISLIFSKERLDRKIKTFIDCFEDFKEKNDGLFSFIRKEIPFSCPNFSSQNSSKHVASNTTGIVIGNTTKNATKTHRNANETIPTVKWFLNQNFRLYQCIIPMSFIKWIK